MRCDDAQALYDALGSADLPLSPECLAHISEGVNATSATPSSPMGATVSKKVAEQREQAGMVGTRAGQTAMKKAFKGAIKVVKKKDDGGSPKSRGGWLLSAGIWWCVVVHADVVCLSV